MIDETKETVWEAEVNRMAGEIALMSPEPAAAKAEAYFERALAVARKQQAKSWELRESCSHQENLPARHADKIDVDHPAIAAVCRGVSRDRLKQPGGEEEDCTRE